MKITRIRTSIVDLPADEPLADSPENPDARRPVVTLVVETDAGIEGIGLTYFGAAITGALRMAVDQMGELIVGEDPLRNVGIAAKLRNAASGAGPAGIFTLAMSAIDIALWDIKGKAAELPLWRLLGGSGRPVPTYASGAMMRGLSLEQTAASATRLVERGFNAMKMQLALPGAGSPEREIERVRVVREVAGRDVDLMCDVNQKWRVDQAISIGRRLEEFGLFWLEDVVAHDNYSGLAEVAAALATPIAGGEYAYGTVPFRHMLEARAIDIVMVDPFRVGGITEWLKVAGMAEAFGLPVVSHLAPEIQVHMIGAVPNGLTVEYMPWFNRLYEELPWPDKGRLSMPVSPGLGLRFDRNALKAFTVA